MDDETVKRCEYLKKVLSGEISPLQYRLDQNSEKLKNACYDLMKALEFDDIENYEDFKCQTNIPDDIENYEYFKCQTNIPPLTLILKKARTSTLPVPLLVDLSIKYTL